MPTPPLICGFCRRGKEAEDVCGPLHSVKGCSAHHKCMQYSALLVQYKFDSFGGFKISKVQEEINRGKLLKCCVCKTGRNGKPWIKKGGASSGCAIKRCSQSFHYYCARKSSTSITKRIELTNKENEKVVLYRVFCSEKHKKVFEEKEMNPIRYMNDSEESDSDTGSSEQDSSNNNPSYITAEDQDEQQAHSSSLNTLSSGGSQGSQKVHVTRLSQYDTPKKYQFSRLPSAKASSEHRRSKDLDSSIDKLFEDQSSSNSDSEGETSGTSAKDLKADQALAENENSDAGDICVHSDNNSNQNSSAKASAVRRRLSDEFSRPPSNVVDTAINSVVSENLSPTEQSKIKNNITEYVSNDNITQHSEQKVSRRRSTDKNSTHDETKDTELGENEPPPHRKSTESESEGYGSSKTNFKDEESKYEQRRVNSKLPVHFKIGGQDRSPENCVLCFLEKVSVENKDCNKIITPVATKLYNVSKDSVYLWNFDSESIDITTGHMIYLWKDISQALRDKDLSTVADLVCNFDQSDRLDEYETYVKLNKEYEPEIEQQLYYQIRQSIRDNLGHAISKLNQYVGSIHYFKSLGCHVMFLNVSKTTDPDRTVKSYLGHHCKAFTWSPDEGTDTQLVPLSSFSSNQSKLFKICEYDVLHSWFIKNVVEELTLLTRPKEACLLTKNPDSVSFKLKQDLKEKSSDSRRKDDVIIIGPVDKSIMNILPYVRKCVPVVIDERLTARRDVFVIYDVDGVEASSLRQLLPPVPEHVEMKVLCGHDPAKFPLSCLVLQIALRPGTSSENGSSSDDDHNQKKISKRKKKVVKRKIISESKDAKHIRLEKSSTGKE